MEAWAQRPILGDGRDKRTRHPVLGAKHVTIGVMDRVAARSTPNMIRNWQLSDRSLPLARSRDTLHSIPIRDTVQRAPRAMQLHVMRLSEGSGLVGHRARMDYTVRAVGKDQ